MTPQPNRLPRSALVAEHPELCSRLIAAHLRAEISSMDYRRALIEASGTLLQVEIADLLHISQPAVSAAVRRARDLAPARPGRVSATPSETCQRFAAGLMDDSALLTELITWPRLEAELAAEPDDLDLVIGRVPTGADVQAAWNAGLRAVGEALELALESELLPEGLVAEVQDELGPEIPCGRPRPSGRIGDSGEDGLERDLDPGQGL